MTLSDLEWGMQQGLLEDGLVSDVSTGPSHLVVAYPNESVGQVLSRMGSRDLTRAPVVSVDQPNKLLGMIRREDIFRAYNMGLARRSEIRERTAQKQESAVDGVEFVELLLEAGDRAVGNAVSSLGESLPKDCILVSIQRDGHRLIPHGDTVFQQGDMITAYIENHEDAALRSCLKGADLDQPA